MNPAINSAFWLSSLGLLTAKIALVVSLAGFIQTRISSPARRRITWLGTWASLAILLAASLTGVDQQIHRLTSIDRSSTPAFLVRGHLPARTQPQDRTTQPANDRLHPTTPSTHDASETLSEHPVWPAWVWLTGSLVAAGWLSTPRLWLACVARCASRPIPFHTTQRIEILSNQLGFHRRVWAFSSDRLSSPVAFGVLRPGIGLPAEYWSENSPAAQDVILAHELAHLKVRDPLALCGVDLLLAMLWWHPMAWWARHQFRASCETTADEGSLVVENGPEVLAGCLVNLAARWQQRGVLGLLGMAGFRSDLGLRVQRLLAFKPGNQPSLVIRGRDYLRTLLLPLAISAALSLVSQASLPGIVAESPSLGAAVAFCLQSTHPSLHRAPNEKPAPHGTVQTLENAALETPAPAVSPERLERTSTHQPFPVPGIPARQNATPEPSVPPAPSTAGSNEPQSIPIAIPVTTPGNPGLRPLDATAASLHTRSFRVNHRILNQALDAMTEGFTKPAEGKVTDHSDPAVEQTRRRLETLRMAIQAAGVPGLMPLTKEPSGRAVFYNDLSGDLWVRATETEIQTVGSLLSVLSREPYQIVMEAKFVELAGLDLQASGLQGLLNDSPEGKALREPGLRQILENLARPGSGTNGIEHVRGNELQWAGKTATNASNIRIDKANGQLAGGVLDPAQLRTVLKAIESRPGTTLLSAPRVLTLSGREAQIQVSDMQSIVTGLNPDVLRGTRVASTTNRATFTTAQIPVGPSLTLLPTAESDGSHIELSASPTLTEFLGYDQPPPQTKQEVWENGRWRSVTVPLPRFRVRQLQSRAIIPNGHTLVLGSLPVDETVRFEDKVPILGDIPLVGRLFRSRGTQIHKKSLLVFVTVQIVDAAGNPAFPSRTTATRQ